MKEIRTSGPLMFSDPNCPTRVGEIINTISEIYDIPNPSEGMQVYVRDEKKTYTITGLKEAVIGGERVPDAKVDTFEAVKSQVEEIDNDLAEMQEALINGSFVVGIANAVKAGAVTFEMLDGKLQLSASVVDDLETDDALKPLSANQGKVLKELIDIINGTGEGSTDKKITDAIAKLVDNAPENLDTLKELAEWIKDHGTEVAEMLAAINANATAIKTEAERATGAESDIKSTAISKDGLEAIATSSTLELAGNTLAGEEFAVELPPATTEEAGVMSADDKGKLEHFKDDNGREWIAVVLDNDSKIIEGITKSGKKVYAKQELFDKEDDRENRLEITLDADGKIIAYRDSNGVRHETKLVVRDRFVLGAAALKDLRSVLADDFSTPVDWSNETAISLPIPRACAKVNIIGGLATSKTDEIKAILEYWDKSGNYFRKYIIINAQGSSSMAYKEKNQSIDIFNDEECTDSCEITFGNWVAQDSFHLKAYYIDVFRGIANIGYNYCEEIIKFCNARTNRVAMDNSDTTILNGTGNFDADFGDGALCHPDGFPFELFVNGEYYGLYAWNLKKHRKNYSMKKNDYTATLLDGVIDATTFFGGTIDWTQFELRNPKELVTMNGEEYDGENPQEIIDETSPSYQANNSVHVNTAALKKLILRQASAINAIKNESDVAAARALYEQYYDVNAMICYFIASNVISNVDGFRKNWIWSIYNQIAAPTFYDLDTLFGREWSGLRVYDTSIEAMLGHYSGYPNLPTGQLERLYDVEIKEMYKALRIAKVIDVEHIMSYVNDWISRVGIESYRRNLEKWPSIPSYREEKVENDGTQAGGMFDSPQRIKLWLTARIARLDEYFNYK